jgi:hypothetical protein
MASVIQNDRGTVEDLLLSAIRFKQVEELKELADQHPESALTKLLADGGEILSRQLGPLIHSPSMRWEKSRY